jgi:hypothetical protein
MPAVNDLIYAFRRDLPQHAVCRPWLVAVVSGDARFGLSPVGVERGGADYDQPARLQEAERDPESVRILRRSARTTPLLDRRAGRSVRGSPRNGGRRSSVPP